MNDLLHEVNIALDEAEAHIKSIVKDLQELKEMLSE